MTAANIKSVLKEDRAFAPPAGFQQNAHLKTMEEYQSLYRLSIEQPQSFWADQARSRLDWHKEFTKVLTWQEPFAEWFADGELNVSYNCLDRHLQRFGNKVALYWEGEPGDRLALTYAQLHEQVCKFANVLRRMGYKSGDVATIYLPMIPEIAVAMLACARLGIAHNVVFAGFSADSIVNRSLDAGSSLMITADGGWRKGAIVELKTQVDAALLQCPKIRNCIVVKRCNNKIDLRANRDFWWHELLARESKDCPAPALPAELPLFLLYTSGSTGKPKGILHTSAGYLLGANLSFHYVFDHRNEDVFWCTADVGWVTGHSYVIYGPLSNAASIVMYEGAPTQPTSARFWEIIERYKVTQFYTAPTAIRALMKTGREIPDAHDLSSLRLLGTVGEPINPEAWMWYHQVIGKERCPIVDTWWQTETGGIMIAPIPGVVATKPGTATLPFFGIDIDIVDKQGVSVPTDHGGYLIVKQPWPSMLRNIHGDSERYKKSYWQEIKGSYFTGDGARRDKDGYIWIMGRIDDVLNVSGHRLSTMELESTLVSHAAVAEAAVVGFPHDLKGEGIHAFVTLKSGCVASDALKDELKKHVATHIGALARPDELSFADQLPKTRSGKIMRRLLRDIAAGREASGDTSTLEDQNVLETLKVSQD